MIYQRISGNTGLRLISFRKTTVDDQQFSTGFHRLLAFNGLYRHMTVDYMRIFVLKSEFFQYFSHYFFIAHPASFTFMRSFDILTMVVLGGLGSMTGSVTGAIVLTFISAALSDFPQWRMIIYSVAMIVLMLYRPQGLFGSKEFSIRMFRSLKMGGKKA